MRSIIFTGSGPIAIGTSYDSLEDPRLLSKLAQKGIEKFIAFEVPESTVRGHYGSHYSVVREDLTETDELRVLDYDGDRVLSLFEFGEFGPPIFHDAKAKHVEI